MLKYDNNSTKKYFRNSTLAFPKTCEYACALIKPDAEKYSKWSIFAAVGFFVYVAGCIIYSFYN